MASSGTTAWLPSIFEVILDSYERIGMDPTALENKHIISARRASNFILADWSGNRGVNLWKTGDPITLALQPGQQTYRLDPDIIDLLDCYRRIYTASTNTVYIGNVIRPIVMGDG